MKLSEKLIWVARDWRLGKEVSEASMPREEGDTGIVQKLLSLAVAQRFVCPVMSTGEQNKDSI